MNDLEAMKSVGVSIAVGDAVDAIKSIASIKLYKNCGSGAFREVVDLLIAIRKS